ncbi:MAG: hypothetical protein LBG52_02200 [Candidatus Peribacteria bacterium]|jgi:hypothetical protein|nr:hypothetical protein [Candidatus Peribacteria bacterium]
MAKKSFVDKEIKSSSYGKSGITFENLDSQVALTENTILVGVDNAGELVPAIKEADVAKKADIDQVVVQNVEVGVD